MAVILKPDKTTRMNDVVVNEYLLTNHNPNGIAMPSGSNMSVIGVTIHNTDWITVADGTTPAEQYTRATVNGAMNDVRVHFYVDDVCAWQNLPLTLHGWHAADGSGDGNMKTIAIECIMSPNYYEKDKKSEDNCARLAAALLKKYGLGIDQLYSHNHWYSRKYCPAYILPHWETFRKKVQGYLGYVPQDAPKELYRIRLSWDDAKSQIGAFASLDNAIKECKAGYSVYDSTGKKIYPAESSDQKTEDVKQIRILKKGMTGKDVEAMQSILINKGYSCGTCGSDGDFGAKSESALIEFQKHAEIDTTGICNGETWKALIEK